MMHFEYMEQQGQMTIFELLDEFELIQFKRSSSKVDKSVDKNLKRPRKVGYIVRG